MKVTVSKGYSIRTEEIDDVGKQRTTVYGPGDKIAHFYGHDNEFDAERYLTFTNSEIDKQNKEIEEK